MFAFPFENKVKAGSSSTNSDDEWEASWAPRARVAAVACGYRHTAVVDAEGRLFTCGDDRKIQLGLGDTRSQDYRDMRAVSATSGNNNVLGGDLVSNDTTGNGEMTPGVHTSTSTGGSREAQFDERGVLKM